MTTTVGTKYDVGGVMLDRPFKIRRLGHFGFNVVNMDEAKRFYVDLLGFKVSDVAGFFTQRLTDEQRAKLKSQEGGFFTRHNTDHHTFVLFNKQAMDMLRGVEHNPVTINQITWQVGSLQEVGDAAKWLSEQGAPLQRVGRDMPGSNWHAYVNDPDGHTNELYYGIEQVGWEGYSKPRTMYHRGFREAPELPQINEFEEVQDALKEGIDLESGYRHVEELEPKFDVQGIMLPRPFKITRIGPVGLFVDDLDAAVAYYRDTLGFEVTEEMAARGRARRPPAREHGASRDDAGSDVAARQAGHERPHDIRVLRLSGRQLPPAQGRLRLPRGERHARRPQPTGCAEAPAWTTSPTSSTRTATASSSTTTWSRSAGTASVASPASDAPSRRQWPETVEPLPDAYNGEVFLGPWG